MGDSIAAQYLAGLSPLLMRLNMGLEALGGSSCPTLEGVALKGFRRKECILARDEALKRLRETKVPIIYTQKWTYYDDATIDYAFESEDILPPRKGSYAKLALALERTLDDLVARGHRIVIIGNQVYASCVPNHKRLLQGPLPHAVAPPCPARSKEEVEKSNASMDHILSRIQEKWPDKVELLRPENYFCDKQCPVEKDGIWLYFDASHFSVAGSNYMVSRAEPAFRDFLTKN